MVLSLRRPFPALLLMSAVALAQSNFASLSGRIEDSSHSPVKGVRVLITAKDTGAARSVVSNIEGLFEAVNLPPGAYSLDASAP